MFDAIGHLTFSKNLSRTVLSIVQVQVMRSYATVSPLGFVPLEH